MSSNALLSSLLSRSPFVAGLSLTAALAAGCGDPLVTAQDRGDAVLGVHGQALSSAPVSGQLAAAVLYTRIIAYPPAAGGGDGGGGGGGSGGGGGGSPYPRYELENEVIAGQIEGSFPAAFSVELKAPARTYSFDTDIFYANLDGSYADGVFSTQHAPDGVRIGHLLIGPASELAAVPPKISFNSGESRTIGQLLRPYLPNTTITSYQVIYAEGVSQDDVIYPESGEPGSPVTGGLHISEGFTLADARTYLKAVKWQECANDHLGVRLQPEYLACVAANQGRIGCEDACPAADRDELTACRAACAAQYPNQLDENGCAWQVAQPQIDADCGPEQVPDAEQLRLVHEDESLTVKLGEDDIKSGMWMLHISTP